MGERKTCCYDLHATALRLLGHSPQGNSPGAHALLASEAVQTSKYATTALVGAIMGRVNALNEAGQDTGQIRMAIRKRDT